MKHNLLRLADKAKLQLNAAFANFQFSRLQINVAKLKETPIIINNFNRVKSLRGLLKWLEDAGYNNIHIIDNASTYPPLLDYYDQINFPVYKCQNLGAHALWKNSELWNKIKWGLYVYTDSDVVPMDSCPSNFVEQAVLYFQRFPSIQKIGLSLEINDLPDSYAKKTDVLAWEGQYWQKKIDSFLFDAAVDTTFAVYKPFAKGGWWIKSGRLDRPYTASHTPWYENSQSLTDEERFYRHSVIKGVSTWTDAYGKL